MCRYFLSIAGTDVVSLIDPTTSPFGTPTFSPPPDALKSLRLAGRAPEWHLYLVAGTFSPLITFVKVVDLPLMISDRQRSGFSVECRLIPGGRTGASYDSL